MGSNTAASAKTVRPAAGSTRQVVMASGPLRGRCRVPGDKSISHRVLIFSAVAQGSSRIRGLLDSADVRSSLACLRALGLDVQQDAEAYVVTGLAGQIKEPADVLDCGNSGTTMRLLCGLLAGHAGHTVLNGDASLRRRPMARVTVPLQHLGARIDGRQGGRLAPLSIRGQTRLSGGELHSKVASAQVKTALLLAGLHSKEPLLLTEPHRSRDHSERLLSALGADLTAQDLPDGRHAISLRPGRPLTLVDIDVPGDISSATFLLVAASLVPGSDLVLQDVGVNDSRTGALDVLAAMGAQILLEDRTVQGGEARATLRVSAAELGGAAVQGALIPRLIDEVPVLAVAAAFAHGTTVFADAAELRVKESDRIASTVAMLRALGAAAEPRADGLVVHGSAGAPLAGGCVDAAGDHRIAMAAAVAGLRCRDGVSICGADAIDVSFPSFFATLDGLRV